MRHTLRRQPVPQDQQVRGCRAERADLLGQPPSLADHSNTQHQQRLTHIDPRAPINQPTHLVPPRSPPPQARTRKGAARNRRTCSTCSQATVQGAEQPPRPDFRTGSPGTTQRPTSSRGTHPFSSSAGGPGPWRLQGSAHPRSAHPRRHCPSHRRLVRCFRSRPAPLACVLGALGRQGMIMSRVVASALSDLPPAGEPAVVA
jgi:hypothetical protein